MVQVQDFFITSTLTTFLGAAGGVGAVSATATTHVERKQVQIFGHFVDDVDDDFVDDVDDDFVDFVDDVDTDFDDDDESKDFQEMSGYVDEFGDE